MRNFGRGLALSAIAGVVLYAGFGAWAGWRDVASSLGAFRWGAALAAAALAAANYLVRFVKWEYYLRCLGVRVPRARSLGIFLAGFSLTVTPGKIGEVLKSYLLWETDRVPMARTAPIVIAERVTDLLGLLILALCGAGSLGASRHVLVAAALVVGLLIAAVAIRPIGETALGISARLPLVGRLAPRLREFYDSTRQLLGARPLLVASLVSVVAWACECGSFYLVVRGFPGAALSIGRATFIYAAMTIAGALSFLPGGLGVQEGGMVKLLVSAANHLDEPTAVAATFVTRLSTLWFAVVVGLAALAWVRRLVARQGASLALDTLAR